ncbi:wax ester/triacylglycerol synthase family O-acyltransferase [Nocardioides caeni]|uniref:Diacylglycerol O-acyltransferase n=1 Tax=Nocardioides caeni TaxID=574700 RepID=A0A4S8NT01_9ACTN|nr:wax ester/triacylglycerol synthase family O-acyltransferase [Nocardioides caeni]THV18369.1 wax ester/triacylglycerol synthase family O-acyltransferase [Nocardioides caeni]
MNVRPAIERMTGIDAGFLYMETPSVHMHTLKIAILEADEALTYDTFVAGMLARLKRLPPLRRRVVEVPFGLNHPVWVTQSRIDVAHHIRRHRVGGDGSMAQLEQLIGMIASTPLNRDHPLWELHYCEGLEGGRVAVVGKMHHALADGAAANALLGNVTDVRSAAVPEPVQEEFATRDRPPSRWNLIRHAWADAAAQIGTIPALLRRTLLGIRGVIRERRAGASSPVPVLHAPRVSFNGSLTPLRSFATVTLPLAELKRIRAQHVAAGHEVTLNDIVLGITSGALRRWMEDHDERPSSSLLAGVPVSADERDAVPRLGGNRVSNLFTTLATDVDDPTERLRVIAETTSHAKRINAQLGSTILADWSQFTPPRPFAAAVRAYSRISAASWHPAAFSAIVSNVPGPREPATVGGARLADLFSVGPLADGIGLNVTVWSYVDRMNFSLLACPDLLPDVQHLASYFPAALAELDLEPPAPVAAEATA